MKPRLKALRALYVSYNAALGLSLPYLAPYLETRGIGGVLQGRLFALRTAASIAAQPAIGLAADRAGLGRALRATAALTAIGVGALLYASGAPAFAVVFVVLALGNSSLPVLLDAGTIAELEGSNAHTHAFGRTRIFGSAAFAISALVFGLFFRGAVTTISAPAAIRWMVVFSLLGAAIAMGVPNPKGHSARPGIRDFARLLRCPGVPQILATVALQWITLTPYNVFFGAHLQHHGGDPSTIGLSIAFAIAGEMVVMATSSRWLPRFSARRVLAFSAAVGVVRWTATALGPPILVVPMQALHAFSFAAFYLSMTDAMVHRTPRELRGSAQALLTSGGSALGSLIGGLAAGPLYEIDQGRTLFLCAGIFSILPALAALTIPPLRPPPA